MEKKDNPPPHCQKDDGASIDKSLKKKMRKLRRKRKKALNTLKEIPVLKKEHERKLADVKTSQKKKSGLSALIVQLEHDIQKRTLELPVMYKMVTPRVIMEYSPFPTGVSRMILDFMGLDGDALLLLPNIPFVRLNLERYSSMQTSVTDLIKEYS